VLEVLAALLILSLLGIGAWNAVSVSLRLVTRIHDKVLASVRLLELDDRIRDLAGRVRAPFWAPDHAAIMADGVTVPYLDGNPDKSLSLSFRDGKLVVGDGEIISRYIDFMIADFSMAVDSQNMIFGITVALEEKDGERVSITARFGSTPLGSGVVQ
jgi:hypothetical protein